MKIIFTLIIALLAFPKLALSQEALQLCRKITQEAERLKCYDAAADIAVALGGAGEPISREWLIKESRSPLHDTPIVYGVLRATAGDATLLLRCMDNKTDVIFQAGRFDYLGDGSVRVLYRIDQTTPIDSNWQTSTDGRAAFSTTAIPFIKALPERGKVFIRAFDRKGVPYDGNFELGNVSNLRSKLSQACSWDVPAISPRPGAAPKGPQPK